MASIWFGDLADSFIELNEDMKGEKAKVILAIVTALDLQEPLCLIISMMQLKRYINS